MPDRIGELELTVLGGGDFFGEMALFDRGVRSAAVRALEASRFVIFEGEKFLTMILD